MYQTIILKNTNDIAIRYMKKLAPELLDSGNIFVCINNEYDKHANVTSDFMDIILAGESLKLSYINTIVVPCSKLKTPYLIDNVLYIVWFAKNINKQLFNKDKIREPHIWKNVEWGKREKNYNPKGKDPGNVWIPTLDDGKGKITKHISLSFQDICDRLLSSSSIPKKESFILHDSADPVCFSDSLISTRVVKNKKKYSFINDKSDFKALAKKNISGRVLFGTSEKMNEVKNNSLSLIVTSPPYWNLKNYYKRGQIGQESYPQYLNRMKKVWSQSYLKLEESGTMWVNINIRRKNNKAILLPKDIINQCKEIGFLFKGITIWHKSSGIPTSIKNLVDRHEYVLIFAKGNQSYLDFKNYHTIQDYKNPEISGAAFWNINRKAGSVGKKYIHPAIFPTTLISRIVNIASQRYSTVLDPFLGSGTTMIAALNNNRNCIGYEFNEGFKQLIETRFKKELDNNYLTEFINKN